MAADSEVIRQFLVSLGFKVDDVSQKKFEGFVTKAEKSVVNLGLATVGAGIAAQKMVNDFANQMEKLYYMAQRSNSSVLNLQAAGSGADRIGVGAQKMQGAIENIARNIRLNPGIAGVISGLGVKVTGRDTADVALDLAKQLNKMPFYQAAQYGNLLGIDADTLFMLQQGLDKYEQAFQARKKLAEDLHVDTEAAAKAAAEYKNLWRDIGDEVGLLGDALAIKLLGPAKELAGVTKLVLADWIGIIRRTDSFGQFVDKLWQGFTGSKTEPGVKLTEDAKARLMKTEPSVRLSQHKVGGRIVNEGELLNQEFKTGGTGGAAAPAQTASSAGGGTRGDRNNNPGNIEYGDFAVRMGAVGTDGRFAIFPSIEFGLRAQAELLRVYSQKGFNSVRAITNRWSSAKESKDKNAGYIKGVSADLGVDPDRRLDIDTDAKQLADYMWSAAKQELGHNPNYSREQVEAAAGVRGITINQKTEINVHGADDAKGTGRVVMDGQDRVNTTLVRQLSSKVN